MPFYTVTNIWPTSLAISGYYPIASVQNRGIGRVVWDKRANKELTRDKRVKEDNERVQSNPFAALLWVEMAHEVH